MDGQNTYRKIAEALPYELQAALLTLRDTEDIKRIYRMMPPVVYIALVELCLVTPWDAIRETGLQLTTAGAHLVNFCTC